MAFLDLEGLQQYTTKLKTALQGFVPVTRKINGKALTEDIVTHEAGVGVTIEDDTVINLDNPVHGIVSQSDFDALSEEERNVGTYFIPGTDDDAVLTPITDDEIEALFPVG